MSGAHDGLLVCGNFYLGEPGGSWRELINRKAIYLLSPPWQTGYQRLFKGHALNMAVQFPPVRSLQDFITDAQFTAPTFHDRDRMENRMVNNLIYYQTNYFLCAILILILVG